MRLWALFFIYDYLYNRREAGGIHGPFERRAKRFSQVGQAISTVGPGAREIRVRDESSAFRVIYAATFGSAIYVLHAFQKKTPATARHEIELARRRYKEAVALERNA